jgi:DNA polymerase I-like protein with 3'-5' exonuclease and polymerase domains
MISLDKKWDIVLTEHDKLVLEVPKSKAKAACKELKAVMEKSADYCTGVPGLIRAEPKICKNLKGDLI